MNANMIRCKNWFCARNNNNDYAEVLFGDSNKNTSQQQTITTTATTTPPTTSVVTPDRPHQQINGKITIATGHIGNHAMTATTNSATGATTNPPMSNSTGGCAAQSGAGSGVGSHVVTFLDDVPSGSNGVVNTTTRLMNHTDLHQNTHDHRHTSDDLDVLDDDFIASQVVSSSLLCDDTLPGSKNCYRLVILG